MAFLFMSMTGEIEEHIDGARLSGFRSSPS